MFGKTSASMQGSASDAKVQRLGKLGSIMRLTILGKIQLALVTTAVVVAVTAQMLIADRGYERAAFALPAPVNVKQPWGVEVDQFAVKVERVFGVGADVAAEFSPWILEASTRHDLDPELIASVVFTESSFRKHVTSHVGAIGPAQVRPYWKEFCGVTNLADPDENIYCGAQILSHFKQDCGGETCALASYNVGPRHFDHEEFGEPGRRYVNKIDRHLERFDSTFL